MKPLLVKTFDPSKANEYHQCKEAMVNFTIFLIGDAMARRARVAVEVAAPHFTLYRSWKCLVGVRGNEEVVISLSSPLSGDRTVLPFGIRCMLGSVHLALKRLDVQAFRVEMEPGWPEGWVKSFDEGMLTGFNPGY